MKTTTTSTHEVSTSTLGISAIDTLTEAINCMAIHAVESKEEEESKKKIEPVEEPADGGDDGDDDDNHEDTEEKDENVFEHYEALYQQSVRTISKDSLKTLISRRLATYPPEPQGEKIQETNVSFIRNQGSLNTKVEEPINNVKRGICKLFPSDERTFKIGIGSGICIWKASSVDQISFHANDDQFTSEENDFIIMTCKHVTNCSPTPSIKVAFNIDNPAAVPDEMNLYDVYTFLSMIEVKKAVINLGCDDFWDVSFLYCKGSPTKTPPYVNSIPKNPPEINHLSTLYYVGYNAATHLKVSKGIPLIRSLSNIGDVHLSGKEKLIHNTGKIIADHPIPTGNGYILSPTSEKLKKNATYSITPDSSSNSTALIRSNSSTKKELKMKEDDYVISANPVSEFDHLITSLKTGYGSSGGGYFTADGRLLSMHIGKLIPPLQELFNLPERDKAHFSIIPSAKFQSFYWEDYLLYEDVLNKKNAQECEYFQIDGKVYRKKSYEEIEGHGKSYSMVLYDNDWDEHNFLGIFIEPNANAGSNNPAEAENNAPGWSFSLDDKVIPTNSLRYRFRMSDEQKIEVPSFLFKVSHNLLTQYSPEAKDQFKKDFNCDYYKYFDQYWEGYQLVFCNKLKTDLQQSKGVHGHACFSPPREMHHTSIRLETDDHVKIFYVNTNSLCFVIAVGNHPELNKPNLYHFYKESQYASSFITYTGKAFDAETKTFDASKLSQNTTSKGKPSASKDVLEKKPKKKGH